MVFLNSDVYLFLADIVIPLSCLLLYLLFVSLFAFLAYIQREQITEDAQNRISAMF